MGSADQYFADLRHKSGLKGDLAPNKIELVHS